MATSVASPAACGALCDSNAQCKGVSFNVDGRCILKNIASCSLVRQQTTQERDLHGSTLYAPDNETCTAPRALLDPTSTAPHVLRFARAGLSLRIYVDSVEKCAVTIRQPVSRALIEHAPLRFGAYHMDARSQSLMARLNEIRLSGEAGASGA